MGKGLEAPLADANEIRIGAYTMLVTKTLQMPSAQTLLRADAADGKIEPQWVRLTLR